MADQKVIVVQVRSSNRTQKRVKATLDALGLGRIGNQQQHQLTPSTVGMIDAVRHLVEVRKA